jgi:hypothetical protein
MAGNESATSRVSADFSAANPFFQVDPIGWDSQAEARPGCLVKARLNAKMKALS